MSDKVKGVYRFKLDLLVVAKDRAAAEKAIRVRQPFHLRSWETITVRDTDGRVSPGWRVSEDNGTITVEPKNKRRSPR